MNPGRRRLTYAVGLCLAGAGLALFATTRTWAVEFTARPAPLPGLRTSRIGADLVVWLPALALVGLAGAGAVLATRGLLRRLVGALLLAVGVATVGGAGLALTGSGSVAVGPAWPLLCLGGGLLTAAGGALTVAGGHRWPTMGARYDRRATRRNGRAGATATAVEVWDALDRGEDPTLTRPGDREPRA